MYNPSPVIATAISFTNPTSGGNSCPSGGTIYGSNDNSTYTALSTFTNSNSTGSSVWQTGISSANQNAYKYYKVFHLDICWFKLTTRIALFLFKMHLT